MYAIISTMVRDDNAYLDEWVQYHLSIGFEHIVMFDHKSIVPVVNNWGDKVTLKRIDQDLPFAEYVHKQVFREYKAQWILCMDVDEFVVLLQHNHIKELLVNYENYGGLGIPWSMYGSSGHIKIPKGSVKDNYIWRTLDTSEPQYVKTIASWTDRKFLLC